MSFILTKDQLLSDIHEAYKKAKKGKSDRNYVTEFEKNLEQNLMSLCDELYERRYTPLPSFCFIVEYPKKREVFAAHFKDRIVHHLYFDYTHEMFERTFIQDSYSCIKDRGTHYGIERLEHHIRQESNNYHDKAYILKMDIKGYFMNIDRNILLRIVNSTIDSMKYHRISFDSPKKWEDVTDFDFIKYLSKVIIMVDPTKDCIFCSKKEMWDGLPSSKTLFGKNDSKGLPIGNLTSQLFSNVYLNELDQFVKRTLKCRHYGRYVDDFFLISRDKQFLHNSITKISDFLLDNLGLSVQQGKTIITSSNQGVEFLGAYLRPYRKYISNKTLKRMKGNLYKTIKENPDSDHLPTVNSYLGILKHYSSYNIRVEMFCGIDNIYKNGAFNADITKMIRRP